MSRNDRLPPAQLAASSFAETSAYPAGSFQTTYTLASVPGRGSDVRCWPKVSFAAARQSVWNRAHAGHTIKP
jgi:hypothetical protein